MINRAKMPRQLRDKGGIASVTPRKKYGLGSKLKERFRKLVPNELADIAVKAAPFVAPFNPGIAGLMRGIGRFDQRGSISDAFKQGVGTFAFGAGVRSLGGATDPFGGGLRGGFTSPLSPDRTTAVKEFFNPRKESTFDALKEDETIADKIATEATEGTKKIAKDVGLGSIRDATGLFKDIPILKDLPSLVQQQILVGGVTSAATYIYQAFLADEPPQEEGETYDEYMARRKENVGRKMRSYFDNYFKFDKDYSAMTDEQKQAFIDRVNVKDGGRIGYQTGGVTMANTLAENIRRNLANQAAINQRLQQARARLDEIRPGRIASQSQLQQEANKIAAEDLNRMTGGARGVAANITGAPTMSDIQAAIAANRNVNRIQTGPRPEELDPFGLLMSSTMLGPTDPKNNAPSLADMNAIRDRVLAAQAAMKPTYEEALMGESWETLSDGDQYRLAMEYPGETPPRRNPNFVPSLAKGGMPTGIMRTNKAGVMERDYRDKGGFVPVGIKEKADDVPAMLSKNEFVFTADAVRGAGNGSIEKGAQRMYDTMKKLEKRVV
jgi:hypothetical protein